MIWILLIVYQFKHFFADFPLQGKYMLGKFKPYPDFILPLLTHAGVHGLFTFFTVFCFTGQVGLSLKLALFDMGIHFLVDRIKASPNMLGRFKALSANEMIKDVLPGLEGTALQRVQSEKLLRSNKYFWFSLGWDQAMHHLTHYAIIYTIMEAIK